MVVNDRVVGYVMKRSKDDVDKLTVVCESNGEWTDKNTGLVVDDVNELVCVPGKVLFSDRIPAFAGLI